MSSTILDLLYGFSTAVIGAIIAWLLCHYYSRRMANMQGNAKARHAAEVLFSLQELASRVAFDVDKHNTEVEAINDELSSANNNDPSIIVDVVAKLIQANQQMHKKLSSTEIKLRKQAEEIQIHATEARTDALTLLANRRAFDDEIVRRVAEFRRLGRSFSLIMADVDNFKKFNDSYGHQAGDEVLQGVAKLIRRTMREMDLVARYGGEEFAIILPGTNLADACKAAMRACQAVEKAQFSCERKSDLQVTISFGVAELLINENEDSILSRADKALYASKGDGRNCVYCHDGATLHRVGPNKPPVNPETEKQRQNAPAKDEKQAAQACDSKVTEPAFDVDCAAEMESLPELPSRTNFCQQVRNRMAEWKRGGLPFSVVLAKVDQYNQDDEPCNSSLHEFATLTAANYLFSTIREMDVVGQYAPGCFALMLPTAGLVDAIRVAERLREGFSKYNFPLQCNQQKFTLSVGVVQVMDSEESISLMKRAEAAMVAADNRGGNRVYYHDGKRYAPITAMLETMDYLS